MAKLKGKARAKANKKKRLKNKNNYHIRNKELLSLIKKWDDPVLKQVCDTVGADEDVSNIIKELKQVLGAAKNGLGIAASQIGYAKRIFAIRPKGPGKNITIFINSKIIEESKERISRSEGCLSYPGFYTYIERPVKLTLQYEDENRNSNEIRFKDMEACIIFHEHDHTSGICLVGQFWEKEKDEHIKKRMESKDEIISIDAKQ